MKRTCRLIDAPAFSAPQAKVAVLYAAQPEVWPSALAQVEVQPAAVAAAAEIAASPAALHCDCAPVQLGHALLAEAD